MAIEAGICNDYVRRAFGGEFNHGANAFKFMLVTSAATRNKDDTAYSATGEASGTNYVAGGVSVAAVAAALGGSPGTGDRPCILDFADPAFTNVSIADFRGGQFYNDTVGDASLLNVDFGATQVATTADVTLQLPEPTATLGLIRI